MSLERGCYFKTYCVDCEFKLTCKTVGEEGDGCCNGIPGDMLYPCICSKETEEENFVLHMKYAIRYFKNEIFKFYSK